MRTFTTDLTARTNPADFHKSVLVDIAIVVVVLIVILLIRIGGMA